MKYSSVPTGPNRPLGDRREGLVSRSYQPPGRKLGRGGDLPVSQATLWNASRAQTIQASTTFILGELSIDNSGCELYRSVARAKCA
jgi:hypothetical protein